MRLLTAFLLAGLSATSFAADPVVQPSKLEPAWQARTKALFEKAIEIPTVAGRGQVPAMAELLSRELQAAGFAPADIRIIEHEGLPGNKTASLIARWRAERPTAKPIMLLGHMDVVEAKREDWKRDPFVFLEEDGYFYGRGAYDNKAGVIGATTAILKLRQAGWKPKRDLILFFTGDEETAMNGARLGASEWRPLLESEYVLNTDGGGGAFTRDGKPLGYGLQTAEKTYQSYSLTVRNKGGHSSRPRPDNAIYELATALKKLEAHRFEPMLNETSRAYFTARARQEGNSALGNAIRAWLADPNDGKAADAVEANELETGLTRTRCVATMLEGGHADNALPQMARATVNCRIMPGVDPKTVEAELGRIAGAGVTIEKVPSLGGMSTPTSPLRADVTNAYVAAVRCLHGPGLDVVPVMSTGATDGLWFRAAGIPVYGMDGTWVISPEDERAHGLDERVPVRAMYDNVVFWETVLRDLAGK